MKAPAKYMTSEEAGRLLNVSCATIRSWVKAGLLPGMTKRDAGGRVQFFVPHSKRLHKAFVVKCLYCGRKFKARRPQTARYCCLRHKYRFLAAAARNGYPKPRAYRRRKKRRLS